MQSHENIKFIFDMVKNNLKNIFENYEFNKGKKLNSITSYKNKLVKHQPKKMSLSFDDVVAIHDKNKGDISITLLNKNIVELIEYVQDTVKRKFNTFNVFYEIKDN